MKKVLMVALLAVLICAHGAQATRIRFGFHLDLPAGLPSTYRFLYGMRPIKESEVTADVDIPGLPVISNQRMVYVVYGGSAPNDWEGVTLNWYAGRDCSVMDVHVAIRDRSDILPVLYNELFQLGFRKAIIQAGVNLCEVERKKQKLFFLYAGRQWSNDQLEEAASEIGTMRAAVKLGHPESIPIRFRELLQIHDFEQYRLIQFLVGRAKNDPKKYEADLKLAIGSFLTLHQKKQ